MSISQKFFGLLALLALFLSRFLGNVAMASNKRSDRVGKLYMEYDFGWCFQSVLLLVGLALTKRLLANFDIVPLMVNSRNFWALNRC